MCSSDLASRALSPSSTEYTPRQQQQALLPYPQQAYYPYANLVGGPFGTMPVSWDGRYVGLGRQPRQRISAAEVKAAIRAGNDIALQHFLSIDQSVLELPLDSCANLALHVAALGNNERLVEMCIEWGSSLDSRNIEGSTALHLAATQGHSSLVSTLCELRASPNLQDTCGNTPLKLATVSAFLDVASELLYYQADPNAKDACGLSPTSWAILQDCVPMARLLLECGGLVRPPRSRFDVRTRARSFAVTTL